MSDTPFNILETISLYYEQDRAMTIGQLIEHLQNYDEDVLVQFEYSVRIAVNGDIDEAEYDFTQGVSVVKSAVDRDKYQQRWVTLA